MVARFFSCLFRPLIFFWVKKDKMPHFPQTVDIIFPLSYGMKNPLMISSFGKASTEIGAHAVTRLGKTPLIVLSASNYDDCGVREWEERKRLVRFNGGCEERTRCTYHPANNTYEEALSLKDFLDSPQKPINSILSILIVSHRLHTRRALLIFKEVFPGVNIYHMSFSGKEYDVLGQKRVSSEFTFFLSNLLSYVYFWVFGKYPKGLGKPNPG